MINVSIQLKDKAWIIKLSTYIKNKERSKEIKGIYEEKDEIVETLFATLKTKEDLEIITNDEEIKFLIEEILSVEVKIKDEHFDFSEIIKYEEENNPEIPKHLEKSMKEICIFDTKEQNQVAVGTHFVRAYLYFSENPEKIKEIKLLADLKKKGLYDKDILMEDILQTIEETMIN